MAKEYLEIEFKSPPKAWLIEAGNHDWVIEQVTKLDGWEVEDPEHVFFDLGFRTPRGVTADLTNDEWFVVFDDDDYEYYSKEEFEAKFRTK